MRPLSPRRTVVPLHARSSRVQIVRAAVDSARAHRRPELDRSPDDSGRGHARGVRGVGRVDGRRGAAGAGRRACERRADVPRQGEGVEHDDRPPPHSRDAADRVRRPVLLLHGARSAWRAGLHGRAHLPVRARLLPVRRSRGLARAPRRGAVGASHRQPRRGRGRHVRARRPPPPPGCVPRLRSSVGAHAGAVHRRHARPFRAAGIRPCARGSRRLVVGRPAAPLAGRRPPRVRRPHPRDDASVPGCPCRGSGARARRRHRTAQGPRSPVGPGAGGDVAAPVRWRCVSSSPPGSDRRAPRRRPFASPCFPSAACSPTGRSIACSSSSSGVSS